MPFFQQCLTTTFKKQWQECETLVAGIVSSSSCAFQNIVLGVVKEGLFVILILLVVPFAECPKGHPYYIGDVSSTHLLFTKVIFLSSDQQHFDGNTLSVSAFFKGKSAVNDRQLQKKNMHIFASYTYFYESNSWFSLL